jgi:hypothetical protein
MTEPQFFIFGGCIHHPISILPRDANEDVAVFRFPLFSREIQRQGFPGRKFPFEDLAFLDQIFGGLSRANGIRKDKQ